MTHTPTARRDRLIVRELENETLVYDQERDEAHCLNQTAALVWKLCDGLATVEEIATRLGVELHETVDPKIVWLALGQLRRKRLLLERVPRQATKSIRLADVKLHQPHRLDRPRISRRELGLRLGQAMVIALPLITTIVAPRPVSAGSCGDCFMPPLAVCCPTGCPCQTSQACCSGQCSAGTCT